MLARRRWHALVLLVATWTVALAPYGPAWAADTGKMNNSLSLVPADAAFYGTMLRTGEQIQAVAKSKAWAKLMSLPAVKQGLQMLHGQLHDQNNPQAAAFWQMYNQPENQQLVKLLSDMIKDEVFLYGGDSFIGFVDLMTQLNSANQYATLTAALQRGDPSKAQARALLDVLSSHLELLRIPDTVIGFKISSTEAAEAQLTRLETLLMKQVEPMVPQFKGRIKREKVAGGDFLTLTLDGSMVPWDQVPLKNFEENAGQYDKLQQKLRDLKLTISVGIRDKYVLLSLGESAAALDKLGKGEALAQRPELKPLAPFADKPLTSIGYASKELRAHAAMSKKDIDNLVAKVDGLLKNVDLPAELQTRLRKDLNNLAADIAKFIPDIGASLSFEFLTDRGQEGYSYDWTQNRSSDGSKPLTLLNHVGGNPLLAIVGRSKYSPENYQLLVKWIKIANGYFEDIALPKLPEQAKPIYDQVAAIVHPIMARLDKTTATMLLPALKDGQGAFVLDAQLMVKQLHPQIPEFPKPMPILEPAFVVGVSDAALLRKGFAEYRSIINDLVTEVRKLNPLIPEFQIPEPETKKAADGTLYYYPLPGELMLDKQIAPNAGLSEHVANLAVTLEHSERLLARMPLHTAGGPLADLNKPRAGAVYFNFAGFVTKVSPWVDYGVRTAIQSQGGMEATQLNTIMDQVNAGLEILKCLRTYSASVYLEDKTTVTHGETIIKDLE
jgi:hypothetical protein